MKVYGSSKAYVLTESIRSWRKIYGPWIIDYDGKSAIMRVIYYDWFVWPCSFKRPYSFKIQGPYSLRKRPYSFSSRNVYFQPGPYILRGSHLVSFKVNFFSGRSSVCNWTKWSRSHHHLSGKSGLLSSNCQGIKYSCYVLGRSCAQNCISKN